jgi:hypothetical protein
MLLERREGWWVELVCSAGVLRGVERIRFLVISFFTEWGTYDDDERVLLLIEYHMSRSPQSYQILSA